eukprot:3493458-Amphidinium_carterae.1
MWSLDVRTRREQMVRRKRRVFEALLGGAMRPSACTSPPRASPCKQMQRDRYRFPHAVRS